MNHRRDPEGVDMAHEMYHPKVSIFPDDDGAVLNETLRPWDAYE